MKIALRELYRRPARFVTATVILTLVAVLVMFLGGLLDGLIRGSTGALRAQDADVIVYSETARLRGNGPRELDEEPPRPAVGRTASTSRSAGH